MCFSLPGHVSAQRVALQVQQSGRKLGLSFSSFIEELVVRRELTDNFCFYNKKYDSVEGQFASRYTASGSLLENFSSQTSHDLYDKCVCVLFQVHMSGLRRP